MKRREFITPSKNRMGDRVPFYGMLRMFAAAWPAASRLRNPRHS
jgi:hypothetical protein